MKVWLPLVILAGLLAGCATPRTYYGKLGLSESEMVEPLAQQHAACSMASLGMPQTTSAPVWAPSAHPNPYVNTQMAFQGLQNSVGHLGDAMIARERSTQMYRHCMRAAGWRQTDGRGKVID